MTTSELPSGAELLSSLAASGNDLPGIWSLLGMDGVEIENGKVSFTLVSRPDFANPLGTVHGGICATLLDSVMGCAVHSILGPGFGYSTLELKVNYIRSVGTDGVRLTGTGTVIHTGRSTATAEGRVLDEQGRLIAHGTTTCLIHAPN
ncbi:PaaI family thioesterase [Nocardia sp. FBN12]|uniref:PaaI family thioesterase n=1 Tax=Nocardia sp. FBN12 TaxID=3419766 RepID=UPI003D006009